MNIDNLAGMFSQRIGVQQSMSSSIMSAIIGLNDDQFEDQLKMFDVEINQWKMALENL
jgi:hypothetical protein